MMMCGVEALAFGELDLAGFWHSAQGNASALCYDNPQS